MYCEITVAHRRPIDAAGLEKAVRASFGNDLPLAAAYARSAVYQTTKPASLFAFETIHHCFVIVRKVNVDFSTYHLEGDSAAVSVTMLLQAAQDVSKQLMGFLQKTGFRSAYKARALVVQLFEDNGRETEMEGRLATIGSLFAEKFGWEEAKSALVPFVTALLLIWLGLKQEPIKASVYSFAIVLTFALVGAVLSSLRGNGKIVWRFRRT